MQRVEVPSQLLEETAARMHAEQKSPARRPRLTVYAGALAACLLLVFLSVPLLRQMMRGDILLTPLTQDGLVREVEVKEGLLVFDDTEQLPLPDLTLAPPELEKQTWDTERYMEYLGGIDPRPPVLPEGFVSVLEEARVYVSGEQVYSGELRLRYRREQDEAELDVNVCKGKLPSQALIDVETISEIKGAPLYTCYMEMSGKWLAQFIREGTGYVITARGVSQEEFVRLIYEYF